MPGPFYEWWDAIEPPLRDPAGAATAAGAAVGATAVGATDLQQTPQPSVAAGDPSSTSELAKKAVQYEGLTESLALVAETINKQVGAW